MKTRVERRPRQRTSARRLTAMAVLLGTFGGPIGRAAGADGTAPALTRSASAHETGTTAMKIRMTTDGKTVIAVLDDTPTAKDFAALLPLTITLSDYAATEKVGDLPRRLSQDAAPAGLTPAAGDIAYYAPWGNLAIFLRDFRYSPGLIRLGTIETGIDSLKRSGPLHTVIEVISP